MPTEAKKEEVGILKDKFSRAVSLVLADYRGVTADEMVELRETFTKEGAEFRVVKDTLARIAAAETELPELEEIIAGPIGIAIGYDDPVQAFKLSEKCRKAYTPHYVPKGGMFEGVFVSSNDVEKYAKLASREELLAKLAMLCESPMRALAVVLKAKIRELSTVMNEVRKQKEDQECEEKNDG